MSLQTIRGSAVGLQQGNVFIPEVWSNEVRRQRDTKFVASNYVKRVNFEGGKGDVVHIPLISRAGVFDKVANTPVNLQARQEDEFTIAVDKHKESSFMIEDILNVQSKYSLRSEYTREAGYALARDMDNAVLAYRAAVNNFPGQRIFNTADGTQGGASPRPLDEAAILAAKQILDEADVPEEGRVLIVSPAQYNDLLTNTKFISLDFQSQRPVQSGVVGMLYGMPVIMTTQIGANSLTGYKNGKDGAPQPTPGVAGSPYLPTQSPFTALPTTIGSTPVPAHTALLVHPEWLAAAVQFTPKTESSRETLYLADAFVAHQLYGLKLYREDHAVVIHTSA